MPYYPGRIAFRWWGCWFVRFTGTARGKESLEPTTSSRWRSQFEKAFLHQSTHQGLNIPDEWQLQFVNGTVV